MRRLVPILVVAALLAGCSGASTPKASRAFCLAADRYNNEIERTIRRDKVDVERQTALVEDLARTAPTSVKRDAELFLDAMRRVQSDPSFKKDDPKVQTAVDNVLRLANQACGVYQRKGGI